VSDAAVRARLEDLAARWDLPAGAPPALERLLALVAAEPQAITTVRDPREAVERHVADSLTGLLVPDLREAGAIADLGSGAGFPGLVLALALPGARVALVESVGRKAAFLERAAQDLGLGPRVTVVAARAEGWPEGLGACDAVTARALAPLGVLLEYAAPLLRERGVLVAWKAVVDEGERADGLAAAAALGMAPPETLPVPDGLVVGAGDRFLEVSSKVSPTPARYPRRPGMARKRPLRAST
jgi:16S rRNA (guanine527-N7)-methyltransferase